MITRPPRVRCSSHSLSLFSDWRRRVSPKCFNTQVPSVFTGKLALLRHACCALSHLCCIGQSILLNFSLSETGRMESPLCSICGDPTQDDCHFILHCLAVLFGDSYFRYDLWLKPWSVAWLLEYHDLTPRLRFLRRDRVTILCYSNECGGRSELLFYNFSKDNFDISKRNQFCKPKSEPIKPLILAICKQVEPIHLILKIYVNEQTCYNKFLQCKN